MEGIFRPTSIWSSFPSKEVESERKMNQRIHVLVQIKVIFS